MNSARSAQLDLCSSTGTHSFREPSDLPATTGDDPLLMELIATAAFQRLKEIRFLGAIDYCLVPSPNGQPGTIRYTRYQHSLGVMRLAQMYCDIQGVPSTKRQLVCAAALLHDIGHPPLSHSMEPVFKEKLGIEHHTATKDIISGYVSLGQEVNYILLRFGINIDHLIELISGECSEFHRFFDGPINFDTIEGILRSCEYVRPTSSMTRPDSVAEAAIRREGPEDREVVDRFWGYKDWVYKNIINSRMGILSDLACQLFLRRNLDVIDVDSYFETEPGFFRRLPRLRALLVSQEFESDVLRLIDEPIRYRNRNYYIDPAGDFFARYDDVRYKHDRNIQVLPLKNDAMRQSAKFANGPQGALFDEDPL